MGSHLSIEQYDSGGASGSHLKALHNPASRQDEVAGLSQACRLDSYLPHGSEIIGTMSFEGPVVIDGHVEGDITGGDEVAVSENGVVTGDRITAGSVVIGGTVNVNIVKGRRVAILATARIASECDIVADVLSIDEGAQFEGNVLAGACRDLSHGELSRTMRAPRF